MPCKSAALSTLRARRMAPYPVTANTKKVEIKEEARKALWESRRLQLRKAGVLPHVVHQNHLPGSNHFLEQGAVVDSDRQSQSAFCIREAARRGDIESILFSQP